MWAILWAGAIGWAEPMDEAIEALAAGRDRQALQVLRGSLDDDPDAVHRCLLGEVALQVGRTAEALDVLDAVPESAPCHGRAAFVKAEALRRSGDVDLAAQRYQALTERLLSPEAQPLAARLEAWADRLLSDEPPDPDTAAALLQAAAQLEPSSSRQLALARRIADLRVAGPPRTLAIQELTAAITSADDLAADDRRRLAPLLDPASALVLLRPLPDDPATLGARVRVLEGGDLAVRHALVLDLLEAHPDSQEAAALRLEVGLELAEAGWLEEAEALLAPLATQDDEAAREAAWALARLAVRAGSDDAGSQLETLLERFPAATFRSEVEGALQRLALDTLRAEARAGRFDGEAWDRSATSSDLALEAAWAAPTPEEQARRLDEIVARWPWSEEARQALRHRALTESDGLAWLRARTDRGDASSVLYELQEPEIGIRTPDEPGAAAVELLVRGGLSELELRLHRIDVEGWLRAGGRPGSLGSLDVAIVSPDATWTVPVPDQGPEVRFEVPVPVPGPGLYAVTAATTDREARTLLLVSDARVLSRTQGPDMALVALGDDGAPTPRARFWIRSGGQVDEVFADREGLARATLHGVPAVVVAETPGGPAILEVGAQFVPERDPVRTAVDLDRPVYAPGDVVRFRALASRAGDPVRGDWRISLVGPAGVAYQVVRATADRAGTVEGEVVVPWTTTGRMPLGAGKRELRLMAIPPGFDAEVQLATVRVIDEVLAGLRVDLVPRDDGLQVTVRDGGGVPVVDQPVHVVVDSEPPRIERCDDAGRLWLPAPPAGLPWSVAVMLPSDPDSRRVFSRSAPSGPDQRMWLSDPRAAPGEPVELTVKGDGEALLRVVRLRPDTARPEPIAAPGAFEVPELSVFEPVRDRAVATGLSETVWSDTVDLSAGQVTLPALDAGDYRLELVRPDGSAATRTSSLQVRDGARVRLDREPVVGRATEVTVDGGWALLTAEGGRMLAARLVPPGRARTLEVDRRWHGEVALVATTATDQHTRTVRVDAALQVDLQAAIEGGRWAVSGQVTDAAGNPMRARVMVRAVDALLIGEMGAPPTLSTGLLDSSVWWISDAARTWRLQHGGWAVPLAAELMAEAAREAEARRAQLAAEGRLGESRMAEVLDADVPLEATGFGLGSSGFGSGGGGFGTSGSSGAGVVGGKAMAVGGRGYALHGVRSVGLWRVVETDREGRFVVEAAAPEARATWRVDAVAVVPGSLGTARRRVEPPPEPLLVVDALRPGWPGDVAEPGVRVVNPSDDPVAVRVVAGAVEEAHTLRAGAVVRVPLGALEAGEERPIRVEVDGRAVASAVARFPLAPGLPDAEGALAVSVPGRVGGTVVGSVALMEDPEVIDSPVHAIVAGRSALAALPVLSDAERVEAMRRVWAGVAVARDRITALPPRDAAQALLLIAEAAPVLDLPRHVVEQAAVALHAEPQTPQERLEVAFARAVAEVGVQEATVGRLLRDVDRLDDEGRGLLSRLLSRVQPRQSPPELTLGDGPQAVLATHEGRSRKLDPAVVLTGSAVALGSPERADWIRVLAMALGEAAGSDDAGPGWARTTTTAAAALSWSEAVPSGTGVAEAHRWPAGPAGRPAEVALPTRMRGGDASLRCGTESAPCRLAVGDAIDPWQEGWTVSGGLTPSVQGHLLVARTPGRYTLHRTGPPAQALHVQIGGAELTPLGAGEVLHVAEQRRQLGMSFAELLASRPSLEDWDADLRARAAQLRFAAADPDEASAWIAAFEDLRDEVPSASVTREDVVHTAGAYHRLGRPERAITVYERAIGQVFLEEAAVVSRVGALVGPLAGLQALREVTLRYPPVPVVRQSEFALPDRLLGLVGNIPEKARERGVTDTELRLMAAAWDRRFVAMASDSPLAPEAGLRLAVGLVELGAEERALSWVERLQRAHPDDGLMDRWMLIEALMLTDLRRPDRARGVLQTLSEDELPLGGGRLGPSQLRDDARLALGRLAEAERQWTTAAERYEQVAPVFPEAALSAESLRRVLLDVEEPLVSHPLRESSRLQVRAANVSSVQVRAYAVDLRTLFLRDSGLPRPEDVQIDGLRPAWSGQRSVEAGPFPVQRWVDLPLEGAGAWLVRMDADGGSTVAWVLRSDLQIDATDGDDMRRLAVRLRGVPAADARIRAVGSSGIVAETTDIRGVAVVGRGAVALAQVGPHFALTRNARPSLAPTPGPGGASPAAPRPSLLDRVQSREEERRQKRRAEFDYIGSEYTEEIQASEL